MMRLKCTSCAPVNCHDKCRCACHKLDLQRDLTHELRELDLELHGE